MAGKKSRRHGRRSQRSAPAHADGSVGALAPGQDADEEAIQEAAGAAKRRGAEIIGLCGPCGRAVASDEREAEVAYENDDPCRIRLLLCPACADTRRASGEIPPVPSIEMVENLCINREEMRLMDTLVDCEERLRRYRILRADGRGQAKYS